MISTFCDWLAATPASEVIQNTFWMIPIIQTIHIVSIAVVVSCMAMLDFRLLGLTGRDQSVPDTARRFLPWTWAAVAALFCTGALLIVAEPARELQSPVFWAKMSLLACVLGITLLFQVVLKRGDFWQRHRAPTMVIAVTSLVLWIGIVVAGRWIAYVVHG